MLTANDIQYHWDYVQNEEVYSKFVVIGDINQYNLIKEFTQENNGASISLEYGAF
jgi:hydroxyacyl-ACP dehydratase HTD2-like protein with hotdog domain